MTHNERFNLQLFADGGDGGGEGAATGAETADAGQVTDAELIALGVPESKLRKRAKKTGAAQAAQSAQQVAAAETSTEDNMPENTAARLTWEQIKSDPEYNAEMQKMMQERVKKSKDAEDYQQKVTPLVSFVAEKYGVDPNDIEALTNAVVNDDSTFEEKALAEGKPIDEIRKQANLTLEQQKIQRHIEGLRQQGEAMKDRFPGFDLRKELQNPVFARMTAPSIGLSVEDAYYAVHRAEIQQASMQATAKKTAEMLSNSVQAGQNRPVENGRSGHAASVTTFDYAKASKEQREELKRQIYAAASRGQKIYPGS